MGYLNKKHIFRTTIIFSLVIFTFLIRSSFASQKFNLVYLNMNLIYSLIYFGLFITWGVSLKKRIINRQIVRLLMTIVGLLLFWLITRTIKYIFFPPDTNISRWLWYAYYLPILLIPMIMFSIAFSLGKPEDYRLPAWRSFMYLPTILLIGVVFTNDYHQLVFKFPHDSVWSGLDYQYSPFYWLILIWIASLFLVSLIITILKSRLPYSKRFLLLPFIPYFTGLIYVFLYIMYLPYIKVIGINDMTAIFSLLIIGIFESLIHVGLIRSNIFYEELFYASDLNAEIINYENEVCYETDLNPLIVNEDIRKSTFEIAGGQVHWLEDISEMNTLINQLKEVNQRLAEENNLLQAELELKERKIVLEEKTRLYNQISKAIEPQLKQVREVLNNDEDDLGSLKDKLQEVLVLGTYIKRRSNLLLLKEDKNRLSAKELEYCIRESLEAISLSNVEISLKAHCVYQINADDLILIYDLFEAIIETLLLHLNAILVNLKTTKKSIDLKLQIHCDNQVDIIKLKKLDKVLALVQRGGHIQIDYDDDLAIHISLLKGGD